MDIIKSQNGKQQLLYEGYRYRCDKLNRSMQSSVACLHPTIYTLVHHFRREQDLTEQTISRIQSGITNSQAASKSKYVQLSRRLAAILHTYAGRDLNDYLRAVSHNIDI